MKYLTTDRGILFQDDCLKILPYIKDNSIDCVFADPPFNLGKDYKNGYDDQRKEEEYLEWCATWINHCCRILKNGGSFFLYATPGLNIKFGNVLTKNSNSGIG